MALCGRIFELPCVSLHLRTWLLALGLRSAAPPGALLTNDGLPLPIGLCDLIGAAHLAKGHAADDEDNDPRPSAVLSRCLVLVPVAIPSTAEQEDRATLVQFYSSSLSYLGILAHSLTTVICSLRGNCNYGLFCMDTQCVCSIQELIKLHHKMRWQRFKSYLCYAKKWTLIRSFTLVFAYQALRLHAWQKPLQVQRKISTTVTWCFRGDGKAQRS